MYIYANSKLKFEKVNDENHYSVEGMVTGIDLYLIPRVTSLLIGSALYFIAHKSHMSNGINLKNVHKSGMRIYDQKFDLF